jgi:hypothetical protein
MSIWQVVDTNTSKGLPSARKVIETFNNIQDASSMAKSTDGWKVRMKPAVRRKKDEEDE